MVPNDPKTEVVPPAEAPDDLPLPSDPKVIFLGGLFVLAVLAAAYVVSAVPPLPLYLRYRIGPAQRKVEIGPAAELEVVDPTIVLIPDVLSKIRPRNCPNQSYVRCITDSGPAPGVGG